MDLPSISQEDLSSFHAAHFSSISTDHFSQHFLGPVEQEDAEEADDGLGYYEDGVKRTLTDEQIAIFRHSEIQAILRERRHAAEAREDSSSTPLKPSSEEGELDEGEIEDDSPITNAPTPPAAHNNKPMSKKAKKSQWAKEKGFFKQNVKPDLRKRTWDKVDTGLGSLDYDEIEGKIIGPERPIQRKKVCYDDD